MTFFSNKRMFLKVIIKCGDDDVVVAVVVVVVGVVVVVIVVVVVGVVGVIVFAAFRDCSMRDR